MRQCIFLDKYYDLFIIHEISNNTVVGHGDHKLWRLATVMVILAAAVLPMTRLRQRGYSSGHSR